MGLRVEGPQALSATLFRAIRNLETKGAVGLQRTARGQITRVRLTATGRSASSQKENYPAKLRVLSDYHPAAKHMIFDLGVQAAHHGPVEGLVDLHLIGFVRNGIQEVLDPAS